MGSRYLGEHEYSAELEGGGVRVRAPDAVLTYEEALKLHTDLEDCIEALFDDRLKATLRQRSLDRGGGMAGTP